MKDIFAQLQSMPKQSDVLKSDTALVVVDMQYMFCSTAHNVDGVREANKRISWLRDLCDEYAIPSVLVFYTVKGGKGDKFVAPDTAEALYRQRLSGAFEIVQKDYTSAFESHYRLPSPTRFEQSLAEYPNVKRLLFTGVNTSVCVAASAREAVRRGYESIVIADACANVCPVLGGDAQEDHDASLRNLAGHHDVKVTDFVSFKNHKRSGRPLRLIMDKSVADVPIGLSY